MKEKAEKGVLTRDDDEIKTVRVFILEMVTEFVEEAEAYVDGVHPTDPEDETRPFRFHDDYFQVVSDPLGIKRAVETLADILDHLPEHLRPAAYEALVEILVGVRALGAASPAKLGHEDEAGRQRTGPWRGKKKAIDDPRIQQRRDAIKEVIEELGRPRQRGDVANITYKTNEKLKAQFKAEGRDWVDKEHAFGESIIRLDLKQLGL
jgi:hypothetical protein